jgi:peroxiredoxin/outer membrane lipoprotein-sorting protein
MQDAPAIAFESQALTRIDSMDVGKSKAKVVLERPNRARLQLSGLGQDALIVLDGTTSWHYLKARNGFVKAEQLGTMKLEQYGAGPLAILFFEKGTGPLQPYLADANVTDEKLDGEACRVVAWKLGSEETRLWIHGDRLRRFATTRLVDDHRFEQVLDFGVLDLAPNVAEDAFAFVPPDKARQLAAGDETKLLAVGTNAPDFIATTLDGKQLELSDFKGKPVVLSFWFHACANCREELHQLKQLYAEYSERGLVLLAVNFGDQSDVVRAYFEKEKFGFTAALQKKDEVSQAFGLRAYPTNYVVGADGKIAYRATGFDERSLKAAVEKVMLPR